jgi:hypothetical protein
MRLGFIGSKRGVAETQQQDEEWRGFTHETHGR